MTWRPRLTVAGGVAAVAMIALVWGVASAAVLRVGPVSAFRPIATASPAGSSSNTGPIQQASRMPTPAPPKAVNLNLSGSVTCRPGQASTLAISRLSASGNGAGSTSVTWSASDNCRPPYNLLMYATMWRSDGQILLWHFQLGGLVGSMQQTFSCIPGSPSTPYFTATQYTLSIQDTANHLVEKTSPQVTICR